MISTSVKWYRWFDKGLEDINRRDLDSYETRKTLFTRLMVNGFNEQPVNALVNDNGTVTLTLPADHGYSLHDVLALSGADEPGFNVEMRVIEVSGAKVKLSGPANLPSSTRGTIKAKRAPLGWEILFDNGSQFVLHSKAGGSQYYFVHTTDGRSFACEGMPTADAPSNVWYTRTSDGSEYNKSQYPSGYTSDWDLIGDSQLFYWFWGYHSQDPWVSPAQWKSMMMFGRYNPVSAADPGHTLYVQYRYNDGITIGFDNGPRTSGSSDASITVSRELSGAFAAEGVHVNLFTLGLDAYNAPVYFSNSTFAAPVYVNSATVGQRSSQSTNWGLRGTLPGIYCVPRTRTWSTFSNIQGLEGHVLLAASTERTYIAVDVIGPWR